MNISFVSLTEVISLLLLDFGKTYKNINAFLALRNDTLTLASNAVTNVQAKINIFTSYHIYVECGSTKSTEI